MYWQNNKKYANINIVNLIYADVAELADALVLGTSVNDVGVQVPSSAPEKQTNFVSLFFICINEGTWKGVVKFQGS